MSNVTAASFDFHRFTILTVGRDCRTDASMKSTTFSSRTHTRRYISLKQRMIPFLAENSMNVCIRKWFWRKETETSWMKILWQRKKKTRSLLYNGTYYKRCRSLLSSRCRQQICKLKSMICFVTKYVVNQSAAIEKKEKKPIRFTFGLSFCFLSACVCFFLVVQLCAWNMQIKRT